MSGIVILIAAFLTSSRAFRIVSHSSNQTVEEGGAVR